MTLSLSGIATCFLGFSTFTAKPLIHIDDLAVLPAHRNQEVGRAYEALGFVQAEQVKTAGACLSLTKPISS